MSPPAVRPPRDVGSIDDAHGTTVAGIGGRSMGRSCRIVVAESPPSALAYLCLCRGADASAVIARAAGESVERFVARVGDRMTASDLVRQPVDRAVFLCSSDGDDDDLSARCVIAGLLVTTVGRSGGGWVLIADPDGRRTTQLDAVARFARDVVAGVAAPVGVEVMGGMRVVVDGGAARSARARDRVMGAHEPSTRTRR